MSVDHKHARTNNLPPKKGHPLNFLFAAGTTVRSFNSVAPGRHVFSLEGEDGWQLSNQFACLQIKEIGVEPKIGVPENGWFIVENPIKIDDVGVCTPIFRNTQILIIVKIYNMVWGSSV